VPIWMVCRASYIRGKVLFVHMLAVGTVEKTQLLLAVGGGVGGVDVEQDFATLADLFATTSNTTDSRSLGS
jgi:hypothetical protein